MNITVTHTLDALVRDLEAQPVREVEGTAKAVRNAAQRGNRAASQFARKSAGAHGKHYHRAFTAEMLSARSAVYGPDASRPQGGMSFEFGSRNQPPHLDLAKSTPVAGEVLARGIGDMLDRLYW